MDDVARLAGVSKATVSRARARSALVNEETRERILDVVMRSGYRINKNAQRLREKRTNSIAIVTDLVAPSEHEVAVPSMTHTLLSDTVRALAMREKGRAVVPADAARPAWRAKACGGKVLDGFIFWTRRDRIS